MATFGKGGPPVRGFWSLTMYDAQHFFVPNGIKRFSIGTKNKDLTRNPNGTVTIYVQADEPSDPTQRRNWLPAPKGRDFSLFIRANWPADSVLDGLRQPLLLRADSTRAAAILEKPVSDRGTLEDVSQSAKFDRNVSVSV